MEFYVADSYKGYKLVGTPFEKSGKMYSKARCKCNRCVKGIYVSRIEKRALTKLYLYLTQEH